MGDVNFIKDFYYCLVYRVGELSYLVDGLYVIVECWNLGEEYWGYVKNKFWSLFGYLVYYVNEVSV